MLQFFNACAKLFSSLFSKGWLIFLFMTCFIKSTSALQKEEFGYISFNGTPIPLGNSYPYLYPKSQGMAWALVWVKSDNSYVEGSAWKKDLAGEIFQVCIYNIHPLNPHCGPGPWAPSWQGWGAYIHVNCIWTVDTWSSEPYCAGVYNFNWTPISQSCPKNSIEINGVCECKKDFEEDAANNVCKANLDIVINGPSFTQALPSFSGPLTQTVLVTKNGSPEKDISVSIALSALGSGVSTTFFGITDEQGRFQFLYIPPYMMSAQVSMAAGCEACVNTATKSISVLKENREPQMCHRH